MVSTLTRILGPEKLSLAEEAVQEALLRAIEIWPHRGVPESPPAWLMQVARNHALDALRRESTRVRNARQLALSAGGSGAPWREELERAFTPLPDDTLMMMLLCCHPALPREAQVTLTLKTVGGFSVEEIARAFLLRPDTVSQRLVRAKRLLRERHIVFELPVRELASRIDSALETLYLLFNEGYAATAGDDLVRLDVCREAMRLAGILAENPATCRPEVHAQLALFHFQASRLPARTGGDGSLVLLADQDRGLWDHRLIGQALHHLRHSAAASRLTAYHLEAGIAACHALAPSSAETDWRRILELYDDMLRLAPSPVVELNRAVALSMVEGPRAAIEALARVVEDPQLRGYYLLPATLADLWLRCGRRDTAAAFYRQAIELPCSQPERQFLERRLSACGG